MTSEVDIATDIQGEAIAIVGDSNAVELWTTQALQINYIRLNSRDEIEGRANPLADVNVRKAIAMAADWDAIRAALYQYNDAVPNLYYAVNPRVHGFVQRPDSTLRFVTPDRNTWVD